MQSIRAIAKELGHSRKTVAKAARHAQPPGYQWAKRGKPIAITFKIAASENLEDIEVGDITVPSRDGRDYLCVRYKKTEESG